MLIPLPPLNNPSMLHPCSVFSLRLGKPLYKRSPIQEISPIAVVRAVLVRGLVPLQWARVRLYRIARSKQSDQNYGVDMKYPKRHHRLQDWLFLDSSTIGVALPQKPTVNLLNFHLSRFLASDSPAIRASVISTVASTFDPLKYKILNAKTASIRIIYIFLSSVATKSVSSW